MLRFNDKNRLLENEHTMKQNNFTLMLLMTGILAMMILTSAPFAMANEEFICDDKIINGTGLSGYASGDVVIPSEKSCIIMDVTITGEVKGDDIQDDKGPTFVTITNSTIEGDVQIKGANGTINISNNTMTIFKNIQISESALKTGEAIPNIIVENNTLIHGNIQIEKNLVSGDINVTDNTLDHGNIQLKENVNPDNEVDRLTENINVNFNELGHGNIQLEKERVNGDINVKNNTMLTEGDVQLKTNDAGGDINVNGNLLPKGDIEVAEHKADGDITVNENSLTGELKIEKNTYSSLTVEGNSDFEKIECKDNEPVDPVPTDCL